MVLQRLRWLDIMRLAGAIVVIWSIAKEADREVRIQSISLGREEECTGRSEEVFDSDAAKPLAGSDRIYAPLKYPCLPLRLRLLLKSQGLSERLTNDRCIRSYRNEMVTQVVKCDK